MREVKAQWKYYYETRKAEGWSQTKLAKELGVSQSRIAQIESGVGTSKITFDVLLQFLLTLGCVFKIVVKKEAA
ncbi:MAG: helix-turn-helix transcriptional regulator [Bdellovibrionales bacterium]|nr:helix-turn-helix transcriptional regulator [Bdellovibrionales bacterium]